MSELCSGVPNIIQDAQIEASNFTVPHKSLCRLSAGEVYAIDAASAVEIDDAVTCTVSPAGRVLQVCIADAGGHLYDKPAIRLLAEQRQKTVYRDNNPIVPMFPASISRDTLGLQGNARRPVVTIKIPVDAGDCLGSASITLGSAVVRRMTYAEANQAIGQQSMLFTELQVMTNDLRRQRLTQAKFSSHTQSFEGNAYSDHSPAYRLVSEAMIAANAALAQFAVRYEIPCVFRSVVIPESYRSAANSALQHYFGKPITRVTYTTHPTPHPVLGHAVYLQGTSPLRRLADFVNQCNIVAFLESREYPYPYDEVARIADSLSSLENTQPRAYNLSGSLEAGQVSTGQLATILFSAEHSGQHMGAKQKALGYLLRNSHCARTIIDAGVSSGRLAASIAQIRDGTPVIKLRAPTGLETSFDPGAQKSPAKAMHMVRLISRMAGLEVPHNIDLMNSTSEQRILRHPHRYMGQLHRCHDLGYQASFKQQADGSYLATAYLYIGGELQQWSASGDTANEARSKAARQLIIDMDYIRRPPLPMQSFETFMSHEPAFSPERCLRRLAAYRSLPSPEFITAEQKQPGYHYSTVRLKSVDYARQLTAVDETPYTARQRAAYRLLKCVLFDLRKMGRL